MADSVEKGMAREMVTEFMQPLRWSSRLWRFHVVRSEDKLQYRLFADDGDFLVYARTLLDARRVEFFLYNPTEPDKLFDAAAPVFTMAFTKDRREWRLVQERCEHCHYVPRRLSCACRGKQQVACIRHVRRPVGEGIFNGMEVHIPALHSNGSRVVWCPLLGRGDLGAPADGGQDALRLVTRKPAWNDDVESLVLDFRGRHIQSSAKNFQLGLPQKPEHVVCQFGKLGPETFSLDFRCPLSVIQAFAVSLTTLFWT